MKTFKQSGNMLSVISPYVVDQGGGVLVGGLFGIATLSCQAGQALEIICQGVFSVAKTTPETWSVGDKAYWNNTTKKFTTSASGALLVGLVSEVAASLVAVGSVLLTQQPGLVDATVNAVTGGIKTLVVLTQAQYDALATKDAETQYNIVAS